ncbi:MAG TPA: 7-cyano-7-deazaguanine synthase QueC [Lentisphaeria bacterium]|nr:MAG: 7-cyano-7-deazaguanine synthase QueC [Lentisphaerae bacterium GWF2_38_69]HBM15340.1 7-cyano-7-deazaguanine synthase QueC [Lentisphaeria bacterium]
MKQKALIIISGGLDSVTALYQATANYDVELGVSFNYSSKHNHKEIPFAKYHCIRMGVRHIVVNLDFMNEYFNSTLLRSGGMIPDGHYADAIMKQTVVPFRNGIMLSIAAGMAESLEISKIIIGAHFDDHGIYPDCREAFIKTMSNAVSLGTFNNTEILSPFQKMKKSEIVSLGNSLGVDFSRTWSCYKGREVHCGKCGTCIARKEAFISAGVNDPTVYAE